MNKYCWKTTSQQELHRVTGLSERMVADSIYVNTLYIYSIQKRRVESPKRRLTIEFLMKCGRL